MKKTVLILSILFSSIQLNAQWFFNKTIKGNGNVTTNTRHTNDYDTINISGFFDVNLVKGEEGEIQIKAESNLLDYILTEVNGDILTIKLKKGININTKKGIFITVPFKDLEEITLNGSGDVTSDAIISGKDLTVKLSGSGDMKLKLDVTKVSSKITGSGDVTLLGKSDFLNNSIVGSGDFNAKNLQVKHVKATVTGSGDSVVFAKDKIDAKVIGSGDLIFYGNPKIENTKVTGSGDISAR